MYIMMRTHSGSPPKSTTSVKLKSVSSTKMLAPALVTMLVFLIAFCILALSAYHQHVAYHQRFALMDPLAMIT